MTPSSGRRVEFDYLRAAAIVMVVLHHAIIAYTTFAYLNPLNPVKTFSPVVNGERWPAFDNVAWLNDTFLMSLLFLVSGLFVHGSLSRRGARSYLGARLKRLGIPFLLGVLLLVPATYYAGLLQVSRAFGGDAGFLSFSLQLIRSGFETAGPLWFLWLLLTFNVLFVAVCRTGCDSLRSGGRLSNALERPYGFFAGLFVVSMTVYLPMSLLFGPSTWIGVGPFVFQVSRILHYLVYFLIGVAIGRFGLDRGIFRAGGPLARGWWVWVAVAVATFVVATQTSSLTSPPPIVGELTFGVCAATLVTASIAVFLRFASRRNSLLESLSDNSYGIYIFHYVIVTWLQYGLLGSDLPAPVKAVVAFAGTLILSWALTAALRRIPAVAKVI